ncbi:MAG: LapA family protein [Erythrobacter sp.]|nr:LapA family protein [Erythrobacter sp.]
MQIVRTIIWVMILSGIMLFSFLNWKPVEITLWDGFIVETKVPALVILAFLLGLVPMWLYHRSVKWGQNRRIRSLENSIKSNAIGSQADHGARGDTAATPAPHAAATPPAHTAATSGVTSRSEDIAPESSPAERTNPAAGTRDPQ